MEEFEDVGKLDDLPVGRVRVARVGGREVALCRTARGVFALDNKCPHRGGPLGEGDVMGEELVCPWHFWAFDPATGCTADPEGPRVPVHEVRVSEGRVWVKKQQESTVEGGES